MAAYIDGKGMVDLQRMPAGGIERDGPWTGEETRVTYAGRTRSVQPWQMAAGSTEEAPADDNPLGLPVEWTGDLVRQWLGEAMRTLRRLSSRGCYPAGIRSVWPEWQRDAWLAYGGDSEIVTQTLESERRQPTIVELGRLDIALRWPYWIPEVRRRRAAIGVAMGYDLRTVGRSIGTSHETARAWSAKAFGDIAELLNDGKLTGTR